MRKFEKELEAKVVELFEDITGDKLSKAEADQFINSFESWMKECIAKGDEIQWTKFFTIKPAIQKARTARNPKTGETVEVPEKKTVKIQVSKAWKREINEG